MTIRVSEQRTISVAGRYCTADVRLTLAAPARSLRRHRGEYAFPQSPIAHHLADGPRFRSARTPGIEDVIRRSRRSSDEQ
jgi:hypothetical protein